MSRPRPLAILLMGPTASGKTDLALGLASRLPCEIISVDSALVYRGMDIGTAKPSSSVLEQVPHRLIDIREPCEGYSAGEFCVDALRAMAEITATGKVPLLVGGTMLYFRTLQEGLAELPPANPDVRARLDAQMRRLGSTVLHERLAAVDPAAAVRIHPNDPQRIQRALEIYEITGRPMSALTQAQGCRRLPYQLLKLARMPAERATLHARIERRFMRMLELGFEAEVRGLWSRGGLTRDMPSMRCVGYRQMLKYFCSEYTYPEMVRRGIIATRQLAKRQLTWLRSEPDVHWLREESDPLDRALRLVSDSGL